MPRIKLTASDGEALFGTLPTGWHDTPLAPYVALFTAKTLGNVLNKDGTVEKGLVHLTAELLGVDPAPMLADFKLFARIRRAAPWLFDGSLPDEPEQVPPTLHHAGKEYAHVGNLEKVSAEQMEALLGLVQEHSAEPLAAAPAMLAVLYCPVGQQQTAGVVAATATAFATLDLAQAWPALSAFIRSSGPPAASIRIAWALEKQLKMTLDALEAGLTATASPTFFSNTRGWLTLRWLRAVRKMLL